MKDLCLIQDGDLDRYYLFFSYKDKKNMYIIFDLKDKKIIINSIKYTLNGAKYYLNTINSFSMIVGHNIENILITSLNYLNNEYLNLICKLKSL